MELPIKERESARRELIKEATFYIGVESPDGRRDLIVLDDLMYGKFGQQIARYQDWKIKYKLRQTIRQMTDRLDEVQKIHDELKSKVEQSETPPTHP